ncbi:MAG: hypothetical protein A2Y62_05160 [Candidatus Fischerbacteria bacterium RBG_13_37_8]|uniref:ABC transporter domain-containing protein n=1 Tax=Candidatus Fischerbacteria bacterium RBG_13_37_8 TaxID=1817863 RepID=A0A1F5V8J6_9BACT|nr:MAG: hypothetical protein A2Y62_05160 [Candidatus Fischerbacteria bacterium RBG_13_37_8]
MNELLLSTENLGFHYARSQKPVLTNINYQHHAGEKILLMGKTGAGKSTLCFCLKGLIPEIIPGNITGRIIFRGNEIKKPAINIGLVLQEFEAQIFNSTVELEIAFGLQNLCIPQKVMHEIVHECIKKIGLSTYEKISPFSLSGGQKQRLAIASILAMKPEIFFLDEPMTDLDTEGRAAICQIIIDFASKDKSILLVDNELDNALYFDKIYIMDEGKIIIEDNPENVLLASDQYTYLGLKPPIRISLFEDLKLPKRNALRFDDAIESLKKFYPIPAKKPQPPGNPESSQEPLLVFDHVHFQYPHSTKGLSDICLQINKGDFVGLIGANGSGKTTLLKLMIGILVPSSGTLLLNNKQPHKIPPEHIPNISGFVFQNPDYQIFTNSISEELIYCLKAAKKNPSDYRKRIENILEIVHLHGLQDEDPFLLTKGGRQKVAVASALINEPELLILDEPSTGLDYQEQLALLLILQQLNKEGKTIIITTHSLWIIEEYVNRCIILHNGTVLTDEPVHRVLSSPELLRQANLEPPELTLLCHKMNLPFMRFNELKAFLQLLRKHYPPDYL